VGRAYSHSFIAIRYTIKNPTTAKIVASALVSPAVILSRLPPMQKRIMARQPGVKEWCQGGSGGELSEEVLFMLLLP
jgi:hypothetical protein